MYIHVVVHIDVHIDKMLTDDVIEERKETPVLDL